MLQRIAKVGEKYYRRFLFKKLKVYTKIEVMRLGPRPPGFARDRCSALCSKHVIQDKVECLCVTESQVFLEQIT